jgi:hypothetical protein
VAQWLGVFIVGIITGLLLAVLWDIFKNRRDVKRKEKMTLSAIREEISHNLVTLQSNKDILKEELDTIFEEHNVIETLTPLQSGFEDLLKINVPESIKGDTLIKLRHIFHPIASINKQIASREEYKDSEQEVSVFYRRIKKYDESILKGSDRLLDALQELQPLL